MELLWVIALLGIILGPVALAVYSGIRHRASGAPRVSDASEAAAEVLLARDRADTRTSGRGW